MNDSVLILQEEIPEIIKKKKMEEEKEEELDKMSEYEYNYDSLMTSGTDFLLNFLLEKKIMLYFRCD